jgi:hypothetical protein
VSSSVVTSVVASIMMSSPVVAVMSKQDIMNDAMMSIAVVAGRRMVNVVVDVHMRRWA